MGTAAPRRREMWVVKTGPASFSSAKDPMNDSSACLAFEGRNPLHLTVSMKTIAANAIEDETQIMSLSVKSTGRKMASRRRWYPFLRRERWPL